LGERKRKREREMYLVINIEKYAGVEGGVCVCVCVCVCVYIYFLALSLLEGLKPMIPGGNEHLWFLNTILYKEELRLFEEMAESMTRGEKSWNILLF
jgi:hypothetical protein